MTEKPIKATLDNSTDECKTQKPILIQLEDIPQPTDADAGKVLGVNNDGDYELVQGGGIHLVELQYMADVTGESEPGYATKATVEEIMAMDGIIILTYNNNGDIYYYPVVMKGDYLIEVIGSKIGTFPYPFITVEPTNLRAMYDIADNHIYAYTSASE